MGDLKPNSQAFFCKYCGETIEDPSSGFCPGGVCWASWVAMAYEEHAGKRINWDDDDGEQPQ